MTYSHTLEDVDGCQLTRTAAGSVAVAVTDEGGAGVLAIAKTRMPESGLLPDVGGHVVPAVVLVTGELVCVPAGWPGGVTCVVPEAVVGVPVGWPGGGACVVPVAVVGVPVDWPASGAVYPGVTELEFTRVDMPLGKIAAIV